MTREQAINSMISHGFKVEQVGEIIKAVTPQEPQSFKWCTDCKEYDQEKHCCHRWSKVIRNTVEEMKQEQEPILDKISDEIENDWQLKKYPSSPFSCGLRRAIEIIDKYKAESEEATQ